jgi:S1-C subfamily serine protease
MHRSWLTVPLILILIASACAGADDSDDEGSPTGTPTAGPLAVEDLAHAVVQIQALDASGDIVWTGSGTFISADGLILTNGHVVDNRADEYESLAIATTIETDEPPELSYLAEIVAVDYALDLSVIQVVSDLDGNEVTDEFPFVPTGDSETVQIGDNIRILGYPGIGGDTITFTNGAVSGFTSERSVGGRAWIKTDATIAGGNSGGLAVDSQGRLIGIPTIVGSGADEETVDCRYITDTNRDGSIDSRDTCVSVGGFINGLRPVNLAMPLIQAAIAGEEYVSSIDPDPEPTNGFDTLNVYISNMTFADGVTGDDKPTEEFDAMPSGVTHVCGFWDYEGMEDGMTWEALWFIDGELSEQGSIVGDTWVGGESGNWWACILDEEEGLDDGLYELIISVEDEHQGSRAIFVGGDHPPVEFDVDNSSSIPICYVYISPSGAQNWGFDYLDIDEAIVAGDKKTFDIPGGLYDLLIRDCDENDLIDERELSIDRDSVYTVRDQ